MTTIKVGPCGGDRGEPQTMNYTDNVTKIDKIQVFYTVDPINAITGTNAITGINAITINYTLDGEQQHITWGEPRGDSIKTNPFTLRDGEYITSVKGLYGGSAVDGWCGVRQLMFETSSNTGEITAHGPYGVNVGTAFELPAKNGKIVGFHGRCGARLDALGVYVKVGDTGGSTGTGQYRKV